MARVITKVKSKNAEKIAEILRADERPFFYVLTEIFEDLFEIYRGNEIDFNCNKGCYGAKYYASIIGGFDKGFELSEHFFKEVKGSNDTQINIFGYFRYAANAVKNLLRFGNTTEEGRKPIEIYK